MSVAVFRAQLAGIRAVLVAKERRPVSVSRHATARAVERLGCTKRKLSGCFASSWSLKMASDARAASTIAPFSHPARARDVAISARGAGGSGAEHSRLERSRP